MIQDIDLRRLAEYEGPERAFLSVYVSGQQGAQAIDARLDALRVLIEDEGNDEELQHYDENVRRVQDFLESHPPGDGTTCVFSCYALDLLKGYRIELHRPTQVRIGVAPYVRPLAELQDEYKTFAVVAADNDATRVFLVTGEQQELTGRIRGDVKNHVKKGGWSQKRYQRRRDNELQHYAKDVAEFLATLTQNEPVERIVLLGSEETTLAIENELDTASRERVIAREGADLKDEAEALIGEAFEEYWSAEREQERNLWQRIRNEYKADGLAATGATDVLLAVQNGRVDSIIVERDAKLPGVRCAKCENTFHGTPESCQVCGHGTVLELDLVNEIVRQAELTDATVEFADPIQGLERSGKIAALLRY